MLGENNRQRHLLLALPLICLFLSILVLGYRFNSGDQTVILPYLQHTLLDVPFSPHDLLMQNIKGVSTLQIFLAPLFKILPATLKTDTSLEWIIFLFHLISIYIIFVSFFYIARKITTSNICAFLSCLALILVTSHMLSIPQTIENIFGIRALALACTLAGIATLIAGKPLIACALAGFSLI